MTDADAANDNTHPYAPPPEHLARAGIALLGFDINYIVIDVAMGGRLQDDR